jgi:NAD+ synthase (glutamine-hydrolysing)
MRQLRIGMAQVNVTVGDFAGNQKRILEHIYKARSSGVDLLTFPELVICGYPPEDLLFKPHFMERSFACLREIAAQSGDMGLVLGFADARKDLFNAAAIVHGGEIVDIYHKIFLPNYGVFDENRYFRAGNRIPVYSINGIGVGVSICEDIWYDAGPPMVQAYAGAEVIVNISASPYYINRGALRERMMAQRAVDYVAIVAYNNLVGGQDELVFDGNSVVHNERGDAIARGRQFEEDLVIADLDVEAVFRARLNDPRWRQETLTEGRLPPATMIDISARTGTPAKPPIPERKVGNAGFPREVYDALVLGTRDYVRKNGFEKVLIGLSGGIDSALVVAIAVDALGGENVVGVAMPSQYSSAGSVTDAGQLASNMGIRLLTVPIENTFQSYLDMLSDVFEGREPDVTEENIQARIRGNILMAISNKFGWLVLTTGNKSEMATGYTTLYGDMAGGFAVIKDVPKTLVYRLAECRNAQGQAGAIPQSIMNKAPSAELRPDQKDVDTLPPYELLDPILTAYAEEDRSREQIMAMGFDRDIVQQVCRLVDRSEYKRRQAPPGIKITRRAFGRDRRVPITNRFQEW